MAKGEDVGAGVARNLARVLTEAYVKARAGLLPHEQAERLRHNTAFMEEMEQELAPTMAKLFEPFLELDELPDGLRGLLSEMGGPHNQSTVIMQIIGVLGAALVLLPELGQILTRSTVIAFNQQHLNVPLDPSLAVDGFTKGLLSQGDVNSWNRQAGIPDDVTALMIDINGEPPGPIDALNLFRWGKISESQLDTMLAYSRLNPQFVPIFKLLAYSWMSPADAIELAVKGVVPVAQAEQYFIQAGGMADQWNVLFEAAGDAIGNEQVLGLLNQGLASESDVLQVFGRSRMNPIFYDLALELRHKFLQPFQISEVLKAGGATPDQATQWMLNLGYNAEQAAALVASGAAAPGEKAKAETVTMVVAEYTDQIIDANEASTLLVNLGYTAEVAGMYLDLADAKRTLSQRTAAVSAIRTAYIAGHVDHTTASGDLDRLEIPAAARDAWLTDWDVEASTKTQQFTTAQVGAFLKNGVIDANTAIHMWNVLGWSNPDAVLLSANYGGPPIAGSPAALALQPTS